MIEKNFNLAENPDSWDGGSEYARESAKQILEDIEVLRNNLSQTSPYMKGRTKNGDIELTFNTNIENSIFVQRFPMVDRHSMIIEHLNAKTKETTKQWYIHTDENNCIRRIVIHEWKAEQGVAMNIEDAFEYDEQKEITQATCTIRDGSGKIIEFIDYLAPEKTELSETTIQSLDDASDKYIIEHYQLSKTLALHNLPAGEINKILQKHQRNHLAELTAWNHAEFEKIIDTKRAENIALSDTREEDKNDYNDEE